MKFSHAALAVAAVVAVASAAVVDPKQNDARNRVGPVSPEHDPRTSLLESIHRMKLSIDRELVYLARMEEVAANRDTRGMVAREAGFSSHVNDGTDVFAPIFPGAKVPSSRQFTMADMSAEPEPEMTSDPSPPVASSVVPVASIVPVASVVPTVPDMPTVTEEPEVEPTVLPSPIAPSPVMPAPSVVPLPEASIIPEPTAAVPEETPFIPVPTSEVVPMVTDEPFVPVEPTPVTEATPVVDTPSATTESTPADAIVPTDVTTPTEATDEVTPTATPIVEDAEPSITPEDAVDESSEADPVDEESAADATPSDDNSVCFPASASVSMADGSVKPMKALALGDRVRVSADEASSVFMFTHKMGSVRYPFVQLTTASNNTLSLTSGHYLYVNGRLAAASTVQLGDELELADHSTSRVVDVQQKVDVGLYNPQTVHGDLIVDGLRVSTYTTAVAPSAAHAFLMPLRAAFERVGFSLTAFDSGADQLSKVVPKGSLVL